MELHEFYSCLKAFNRAQEIESKRQLAVCWTTANFVGAAFAGKLKPLKHYLKDKSTNQAPNISKEEFDKKCREVEERRRKRNGS